MDKKILVIAEKPSVGRDIAKVLGVKDKIEGGLSGNEYIVSWAIGHLVTLFSPEDYNENLKSWKFESLPIIPDEIKLKGIKNTKTQLLILKKLMNGPSVSEIICATDSGREGELIFRYIYSLVKCKKPVKRLWIQSMTDASIKNGFANLKDSSFYDNLYLSAKCRSEADWLVGINASRAYTVKYGALLSIGRVQTPTLAIITQRHKEINAFVPKDYWNVSAEFELEQSCERYAGIWTDKDGESAVPSQETAEAVVGSVKNASGEIESVTHEEKKQPPHLLYDLTELQRDANRRFGFSAKKTLEIAQTLYEKHKAITYPRTDSRYLPGDMIPKLKGVIQKLGEPYSKYTEYINSLDSLPVSKRIADDSKISDHHAIIPTEKTVNLKSLSNDEKKIFDLTVRRFLQAFYPYYVYSVTKIITLVRGERFLTKGTSVINLGFMELYKDDEPKGSSAETDATLPNVKTGDAVTVTDASFEKKKTKPPKAYTEATLLSAMENAGRFISDEAVKEQLKESGIGTPATRAAIIERLIEVGYIERQGKTLTPTVKGVTLIEVAPRELTSPETTGKWERGLNLIAKGTMTPERFMGSINRYVRYIIEDVRESAKRVTFPDERKHRQAKPKQRSDENAD